MQKFKPLVLNDFALRQFNKENKTTSLIDFDPQLFLQKVNEVYTPELLQDGYADFCKHIFIDNFTPALTYYSQITPQNQHLLKSEYKRRRPEELPVLVRYFSAQDIPQKQAKVLDIILYSKHQIIKEDEAMGQPSKDHDLDYDWGIISIKAQDQVGEIPMDPITILRNALGKDQGGSGVPLDKHKYQQSVDFYSSHAVII